MTHKVCDLRSAEELIDDMLGWTAVGVDSSGDEVQRATSPIVRAHFVAALGALCMRYGSDRDLVRRTAVAAYLRSVADQLDPPGQSVLP